MSVLPHYCVLPHPTLAERKCFEIFRQITWFVNEVSRASDCSISTQQKRRAQPFNLFFTVAYGFSSHLDVFNICLNPGLFCDGTRWYGVPVPFFQSKEKKLFVMYIINE